MWEVYLTEPSPGMDPDALRTELDWPVSDRPVTVPVPTPTLPV